MFNAKPVLPPEPGQPFPTPIAAERREKNIRKNHRKMLGFGLFGGALIAAGIRCLIICVDLDPLARPFRPIGHAMTLALDRQFTWGFFGIALVFFGSFLAAGTAIRCAQKLDNLALVGPEQDGFLLAWLKHSPEGMAFRNQILAQNRRFTHEEWALAKAFHEERERRRLAAARQAKAEAPSASQNFR